MKRSCFIPFSVFVIGLFFIVFHLFVHAYETQYAHDKYDRRGGYERDADIFRVGVFEKF
jgi:hypothetical protein